MEADLMDKILATLIDNQGNQSECPRSELENDIE